MGSDARVLVLLLLEYGRPHALPGQPAGAPGAQNVVFGHGGHREPRRPVAQVLTPVHGRAPPGLQQRRRRRLEAVLRRRRGIRVVVGVQSKGALAGSALVAVEHVADHLAGSASLATDPALRV
uniref:Secreted protein n=1 Tax=Ixodes ricinus TaxID=34613 RepID=A0A6B0UP65_IXORI